MKSLYESIFNDDDIINTVNNIIEKNICNFIEDNYIAKGVRGTLSRIKGDYELVYNNSTGRYIVNSKKYIMAKQISKYKLVNLNNEHFEWGDVNGFDCTGCIVLESLEGGPKNVKTIFDCSGCGKLKDLTGAPEKCKGFYCMNCDSLKTLEGGPREVHTFLCGFCKSLISLKGGPDIVKDYLGCTYCENMKKIKWEPKKIKSLILGLSTTNISEKDIEDFKKKTNAEIA